MNATLSAPRLALKSMLQHRTVSLAIVAVFAVMIGLMSVNVFAADSAINSDVCSTAWTHVALPTNSKVVSVFSGSVTGAPNGFLVTQFNLSEIRGITDAERASGDVVWLVSHDSEYAKGWTVNLYWYKDHYGATVTGSSTTTVDGTTTTSSFSDDTGASCSL